MESQPFRYQVTAHLDGSAGRAGVIGTPHGEIHTPAFVPVGTQAAVKGATPEQMAELGAQALLANAYHLYLRPGADVVAAAGGLGRFMNWAGPTFTDSGGFQVLSLGAGLGKILAMDTTELAAEQVVANRKDRMAAVDDDGVTFRSHIDGSRHRFTPEVSIQVQHQLGADIIFAFDECTTLVDTRAYQEASLERTKAWAIRCLAEHDRLTRENAAASGFGSEGSGRLEDGCGADAALQGVADGGAGPSGRRGADAAPRQAADAGGQSPSLTPGGDGAGLRGAKPYQALFGVIQGAQYEDLRRLAARDIGGLEVDGRRFDGFGIGGALEKRNLAQIVGWVCSELPETKPRHLLGISEVDDLFAAVQAGADTFDCVAPSRSARHGAIYTADGRYNVTRAGFKRDFGPLEAGCDCYTCQNFSRAYVNHLLRARELLGFTLATLHNERFVVRLVDSMRQAIEAGGTRAFEQLRDDFLNRYFSR